MTALDTQILEYDDEQPRRGALSTLLARWPVMTCLFIAVLFMLATNDTAATGRWQEMAKDDVRNLTIKLESGRAARQIAFVLLGLWGAAACFMQGRRLRVAPVFLFPVIVFVAWAMCSVVWSQDRGFTIKRLVVFSCMALAIFGFVRRLRVRDLALLALVGCSIQLAASAVFDVLYATGEYGRSGYRFSGLQHPNHSGINCVFLIFACLYFFDRTRLRRFLVLMGVALVVLVLTKSRSSMIAGLAGIGLFGCLRWPTRNVMTLAVAGVLGVAMLFTLTAAGLVHNDFAAILHMGREDASSTALTGRPMVWKAAFEVLGSDYTRVLTGVGYDSFWTPDVADFVSRRVWFTISEGHNGYIDMLLELGVIGVGCYAFLAFGGLYRWTMLSRRHDSRAFAFCAAILTFAVVHCLTESTMVDPNFATFFSYSTMAFLALRSPASYVEGEVTQW